MNNPNLTTQLIQLTMIKKGIIWTLGILVVLAIVGWGIYIIRQQQSYQSFVHKKSRALLTISLDDILLNQFFDKWQTAPKGGQDFAKKLNKLKDNGIDIKANVFLFSLEDSAKNFYAFFDLKDEKQFLTFLKEGLAVDAIENNAAPGVNYAYQEANKIAFVWKGDELLVGLGFNLDKKKDEMLQLIQSNSERISIEHFIDRPSELTRASLRYSNISTNNFIEFDLKGSRIEIAGELQSNTWNFPQEYLVRELEKENYISKGWINFPNQRLKTTIKSILTDLPVAADSIMAHANGDYLDIEILNSQVIQTDTIINYAVNDNFETVAEKTPYESKVPNVSLSIRGDAELSKFLPDKLFYQWFQRKDELSYLLSTASAKDNLQSKYTKTNSLSYVAIHLADWPDALKVTPILMLKAIASDLDLSLKVSRSNQLILQGTIRDYSHK